MSGRISLIIVFFALVLSGCKVYDQGGPVVATNGLSCQNFSDHVVFERGGGGFTFYERRDGAECSYICPDGTVRQPLLTEKFNSDSELYDSPKADLDPQYCAVAVQQPPTQTPVGPTPAPSRTPTRRLTSTPTVLALETAAATTQPAPSPTTGSVASGGAPLLTGRITMCDTGANLISFRLVVPPPDLTGRTVVVSVAGKPSSCTINPVNASLLTCTMPAGQTFPAPVMVTLDGQVVNDFLFDGVGCAELTTPVATTTP